MIAAVVATAAVWLTPAQAGEAVRHDADPGQIAAIECVHHGRKAHGGWRRFSCYAANTGSCVYYFRVRFTTHGIRYHAEDAVCE